ncbi:hypothetical protein KHX12_05250 [butyrate-producing bacterium]|nr:hypothetical protein [butyrate-producing bacterium]
MKKKYLVTVNGDRYIWQKVDDCLNENEKESLLHEAVRKSLEKRLQVIFRIIYIILIGSAILRKGQTTRLSLKPFLVHT